MLKHVSTRTRWLLARATLLLAVAIIVAIVLARPPVLTAIEGGPPAGAVADAGKLIVSGNGPVAVTRDDLRAIGWGDVPLDQIQVRYRDQSLPTWIHDDSLRFYAAITPTRYMTNNVYFLGRGASPALPDMTAASASAAVVETYTATVHTEQNRVYAPQAVGEPWLWEKITAPATRTFTMTVSSPASGPSLLRIETWAFTQGPTEADHHWRVVVNDRKVGEVTWDGSVRRTFTFYVPADALHAGDNLVRISAPGDTGVAVDTVYVDWIEASYPREFVAERDRLMFNSPGGQQRLSGFTGPIDVYDVTQPDRITRATLDPSAAFTGEAGHRYWAVGAHGYQSGRVQAAQVSPDLRATNLAADYVAIGPADLIEPLQPLLDWHAQHGLKVLAVRVEAVYDQFGDGRIDPDAIHAWLQYATQQWATPPRYVLLVGDASYDPLGYTAPPEANRLPTFLVTTIFGGETGSDVGFAQLTDDLKPDLAVGRAPARTADQVRTFVDKTLNYLQSADDSTASDGDWRQRVLAVADGQDGSFKTQAQALLDQLAPKYQTQLISPPANTPDANLSISALNDGYVLAAYFGHGSVTQWGKDNLFTVKDTAALKNGRTLPVILNFTCLTGLFTHPKVQSLSEGLLWQADGASAAGAVAILAPTSLTLGSDQSFLSDALVREYLADPTARLGDLLLKAWQAIPIDDAGPRDVLRTFLLFGDPALTIAQPIAP